MLTKLRQKKQEGFTIIEVLIVLAIAGLILLVVFLAVPALQRNSRNTQRDNDVAGILGGMSEYVNNNNGTLPGVNAESGTTTTFTIGSDDDNQVEVNLGYYAGTAIDFAEGATTNETSEDDVVIVLGAECGAGEKANDAVAGPSRGYAALYTKENDAKQCRAS